MLFAQVGLNLDLEGVEEFVAQRLGKSVEVSGTRGPVTHFIVEPFVPHDDEYYLSITSQRLGADVRFSDAGGVEIEENWDKVSGLAERAGRVRMALTEEESQGDG